VKWREIRQEKTTQWTTDLMRPRMKVVTVQRGDGMEKKKT